MNSEWRNMAAYVARLERERDELRAALQDMLRHYAPLAGRTKDWNAWPNSVVAAHAALSSGACTEGGE